MTLYDSSVLIDYLDGEDRAVQYVESHLDERAIVPPIVLFELYQGEVFKTGPTDVSAVDGALEWVTVVDGTRNLARAGATVQDTLQNEGTPLTARDAFIAGAASELDEPLAVSDSDFDVPGLRRIYRST
jgi:tRNA(fMet)-specific endonuclease VapC